jgi:hypothetical protein
MQSLRAAAASQELGAGVPIGTVMYRDPDSRKLTRPYVDVRYAASTDSVAPNVVCRQCVSFAVVAVMLAPVYKQISVRIVCWEGGTFCSET